MSSALTDPNDVQLHFIKSEPVEVKIMRAAADNDWPLVNEILGMLDRRAQCQLADTLEQLQEAVFKLT